MIQRFTPFVVASMLLILMSGCGDANRKKIVGVWEIKRADTVLSRVNQNKEDAEPDPDASAPRMALGFQNNGVLETVTRMGDVEQAKRGTWKFVEFNSESKKMTIECELLDQKTIHEVEFVDDTTIKLIPPNMTGVKMKIKFSRQRKL